MQGDVVIAPQLTRVGNYAAADQVLGIDLAYAVRTCIIISTEK